MRFSKQPAWVIYWQNRPYLDDNDPIQSKMLELSGKMVAHIELDDFEEFHRLVMIGAFRVAVLDYSVYFDRPDPFQAVAEGFDQWKMPVNLVVIFGPQAKADPIRIGNVVVVTDYGSEFGSVGIWEEIRANAETPRMKPDYVPDFYAEGDDSASYQETFNLQPELADATAQYLLFFRKFLEDIGIEATTAASNNAGTILFSVEPKDPTVALSTIHEALEVYLKLPKVHYTVVSNDPVEKVTALQLGSEIDVLRNRLDLARAVMETKDATIAAKNAEIAAKNELISAKDLHIQKLLESIVLNEAPNNATASALVNVEIAELWVDDDQQPDRQASVNLPDVLRAGQRRMMEIAKSIAADLAAEVIRKGIGM